MISEIYQKKKGKKGGQGCTFSLQWENEADYHTIKTFRAQRQQQQGSW